MKHKKITEQNLRKEIYKSYGKREITRVVKGN